VAVAMFENWLLRHQNRFSMILHAVGIPLTILAIPAVVLAIVGPDPRGWLYAAAALLVIIGYALQFIGHAIEGNDAGEIILIKKLFHRPYKAIANHPKKEMHNEPAP